MKGSIQKRTGKRGVSWTAIYDEPTRDGHRHQRRRSFRTRREAEVFLAKTIADLERGAYVAPSAETVGQYLARWLEETTAAVKPRTVHTYAGVITRHLLPEIGSIPLAKLSARDVQATYGRLLGRGLSPSTVRLAHSVLHRALDRAVSLHLIVRNVADAAKPPRSVRPVIRTWTPEEARAFLLTATDDELSAFWMLALHAQLRQGELIALRWQDVDLGRGVLVVRRTLTRDAKG